MRTRDGVLVPGLVKLKSWLCSRAISAAIVVVWFGFGDGFGERGVWCMIRSLLCCGEERVKSREGETILDWGIIFRGESDNPTLTNSSSKPTDMIRAWDF